MNCPESCLLCYSNVRARSNYKGHRGYRQSQTRLVTRWENLVKRPDKAAGVKGENGKPSGEGLAQSYPTLWAYMTDDMWEDGKPRARSTFLVFCDGSEVKLWLNDKALKRTAWFAGESLLHALEGLEEALQTDTLSWRAAQTGPRGKF